MQQIRDGRVPELLGCPRCGESQVDDLIVVDEDRMLVECQGCGTNYAAEDSFLNRSLGHN